MIGTSIFSSIIILSAIFFSFRVEYFFPRNNNELQVDPKT